jgi:hypothetical protein
MPSNTNPKQAKIQKTASRKTTMAQRGTVFHAFGCKSSRDFDRVMPSPTTTRLGGICAPNFYKSLAIGKSEIWIRKRGQGTLPAGCPDVRLNGLRVLQNILYGPLGDDELATAKELFGKADSALRLVE